MSSAVAPANVSAQSPPMSTKASPREAAASRSVSWSHSPAKTSGGSCRSAAVTCASSSGSGQLGCCTAAPRRAGLSEGAGPHPAPDQASKGTRARPVLPVRRTVGRAEDARGSVLHGTLSRLVWPMPSSSSPNQVDVDVEGLAALDARELDGAQHAALLLVVADHARLAAQRRTRRRGRPCSGSGAGPRRWRPPSARSSPTSAPASSRRRSAWRTAWRTTAPTLTVSSLTWPKASRGTSSPRGLHLARRSGSRRRPRRRRC